MEGGGNTAKNMAKNMANERLPDFASNLNGREHFLQELPKIEQTLDRDTWTRMTRDLFHNLDRPVSDVRASFFTFLTDNLRVLPVNCAKWALPVVMVLRQLANEMRFTVEYLEFRNWDDGILDDALEVLRYSIYDFLGPIAMLLHYYCREKKDVKYTGTIRLGTSHIDTFGQVGSLCIQSMIDAEIALAHLITHLSRGQVKRDVGTDLEEHTLTALELFRERLLTPPIADQVPTASFTELLIQNQISVQRRSIVTTLDSTICFNRYICMSSVQSPPTSADFSASGTLGEAKEVAIRVSYS